MKKLVKEDIMKVSFALYMLVSKFKVSELICSKTHFLSEFQNSYAYVLFVVGKSRACFSRIRFLEAF